VSFKDALHLLGNKQGWKIREKFGRHCNVVANIDSRRIHVLKLDLAHYYETHLDMRVYTVVSYCGAVDSKCL
jgi:hypothetical protein